MKVAETFAADMRERQTLRQQLLLALLMGGVALLVSLSPFANMKVPLDLYLPIHTLLEFLSTAVAFAVFATIWHVPSNTENWRQFLMALALFSAGWLDVFHALSFKGMPDFFTPSSYKKGINFWLAARLVVAAVLLLVSAGWGKNFTRALPRLIAFATIGLFTVGAVLTILLFESALPATYIDGQGFTIVKTAAEYFIVATMTIAACRFYYLARRSGSQESALLFGAVVVAVLSEQFFISYSDVRDMRNLTGQLFKIISYILFYRTFIIITIKRPYELLHRQNMKLIAADDLLNRQALAIESSPTAILLADRNGNIEWINNASANVLNLPAGPQARGHSLFAAPIVPDSKTGEEIRTTVVTGEAWRGQIVRTDAAGKRGIHTLVVSPLIGEHRQILGFVSVAEDVTERVRASEWNKRVLETNIDGFLAVTSGGRIVAANPAYAAMSGYTIDELLQLSIEDLDVSETWLHLEKIVDEGFDRFETKHMTKSGKILEVDVSASFDSQIDQIFVFVRDLSLIAEARARQRDLERQLQQAQKMEAMGQLTGGIAHDFNNILASILGYSKLALSRHVPDPNSKLATYLQEIVSSAIRARDLIARMLVYARQSPSKKVAAVAPAQVVHDVVGMVRPSIPAGIRIDIHVDDTLHIMIDSGELTQILLNLIVNARDAIGDQGAIAIRVGAHQAQGEICLITQKRFSGRFVAIEVQDSGCGIAPKDIPKLFEPFFTTKEVGKGTGLGLSMVQGIVRRAQGHVVVQSQLGQGSLFRLLFPFAQKAANEQCAKAMAKQLPRGQGQIVWVVDDEPSVRRYFEDLLAGQGYRVLTFGSPDEVSQEIKARGLNCELLITDKTMPGRSGLQLAAELQAINPDLPVILCTGHGSRSVHQGPAPRNIRRVFIKPVMPEGILEAVSLQLDARNR